MKNKRILIGKDQKNMPVVDIFSKRQKRRRGEFPDVYQYETIPHELRVQIIYIMNDAFEIIKNSITTSKVYEFIHKTLRREYGKFTLSENNDSDQDSIVSFFLHTEETEKAIDVIELFFQHIERFVQHIALINQHISDNMGTIGDLRPIRTIVNPAPLSGVNIPSEIAQLNYTQFLLYRMEKDGQYKKAIDELNHRFRQHDVGYQYESGQIIRVDSQLVHSEVIKPALNILSDLMYEGANDEFLSALEHYRKERYKECLNDCLKTFESCIKAICKNRRWNYKKTDTAKRLIGIMFDEELIPTFMQSHFTALRKTLEDGVPTLRNNLSGHGQGSTIIPVPEYIVTYALHLTASSILFLAKANDEMK